MIKFAVRTAFTGALVGVAVFLGRMLWDMVDSEKLWHPIKEDPNFRLGEAQPARK